jgi:hypothetical protein
MASGWLALWNMIDLEEKTLQPSNNPLALDCKPCLRNVL